MSRAQETAELLGAQTTDPRMLAIPLAASSLWLRLVEAMRRMRATTLRFGEHVPDAPELARALSVSEVELGLCLDPLLRVGLLSRESDGALTSPLLVDQAERRRLAAERRQLAATRRAEFETAQAAGTIDPNLTPRQYASRVNGSQHRGRTPIHAEGQRNLSIQQVVAGTTHRVPDHNPRGFSGYRDQVRDLVPDSSPDESRYSGGLTDCSSQGIENSQSVSPEVRARELVPITQDLVPDQSPGPPEVPDQEAARIGRRFQQILGLHGGWGGNSNRSIRHWLSLFPEAELFEIATAAKSRTTEPIRSLAWLTKVFEGEAQARAVVSQGVDSVSDVILTPEENEGWAACRKREDEQFQERLRIPPEMRGERPKLSKKADFVGWRRPDSAKSA